MAQADVGHGVKAVFPEGKLIKGHEIHCMATTASRTFGALLRNKAGHHARDDVFFLPRSTGRVFRLCDHLARMGGGGHGGYRRKARPVDLGGPGRARNRALTVNWCRRCPC